MTHAYVLYFIKFSFHPVKQTLLQISYHIMLLYPDFFYYATRKISIHDLFLIIFFLQKLAHWISSRCREITFEFKATYFIHLLWWYQYYFLSDLKGKKYIPLIKENAKSTVFIINIYLVSSNNFKHLPSKQPVNKNFNWGVNSFHRVTCK